MTEVLVAIDHARVGVSIAVSAGENETTGTT